MHKTRDYGSKVLAKGLLRDKASHRNFKMGSERFAHVFPDMPGQWDLRGKVAPPEDQGGCGSCWAFSQTNSLRSLFMLAGKDPGALSKNYLLFNLGPISESGCNGGDFQAGQNFLNSLGPCLETLSPYTADDGGRYPDNAPVAATAGKWLLVGAGERATSQELCEALWNQGNGACLSVDIAADRSFDEYSEGVLSRTTSMGINHMVRLVGYDAGASVDGNGKILFNPDGSWADPRGAYFIGRNNWNTDWGIDGDFYIEYGVNNFAETAMLFTA